MSKEYHKYTEYKRYVDFKRLEFIVQFLDRHFRQKEPPQDRKGLDLGCGRGDITNPLASIGYRMRGVDISAENIRKAESRRASKDNPVFSIGDAENLNLTEIFEFVICSEVLEHLERPEVALNSINKVLKENGALIVSVPNGYGPYSLLKDRFRNKIVHKIMPRIGHSAHVQAFTLGKITKLIKGAGFEVLEVTHSDFLSWLPFLVRWDRLCQQDCRVADKLPAQLVSGWYLACQKE